MVTIIRNAKVYQPEYAGVKDILILGDRIAAVGEDLRADFGGCLEVQEINGTNPSGEGIGCVIKTADDIFAQILLPEGAAEDEYTADIPTVHHSDFLR